MSQPEYLPTPEQIAEDCRRIQAEWTDKEREKREGRKGERDKPRLKVSLPEKPD